MLWRLIEITLIASNGIEIQCGCDEDEDEDEDSGLEVVCDDGDNMTI